MNKECYVAELKYTDGERVEIGEAPSYVIVEKIQDDLGDGVKYTRFVNVFSFEEFPAFSRSSRIGQYYYDSNGNEHQVGCKLVQESTDMEEGPCYILTGEKMENLSNDDLANMVIYSSRFFKDRIRIMRRRNMASLAARRIINNDLDAQDKMVEYFKERGVNDFSSTSKVIKFRR